MNRSADFNDILDRVRKVNIDWMSTSDVLVKEPVYTISEQFHNDHDLEQVRNLIRYVVRKKNFGRFERILHEPGFTKNAAKYLGTGVMWVALNRWSHVFLKKSTAKLSDSQRWFDLCIYFEALLKRLFAWLAIVYPTCSAKEKMKVVRMLWIATFLGVYHRKLDSWDEEPLFACALLYPLVDDYLDTESNESLRRDFGERLAEKIAYSKPSIASWSSSHPQSKLVGELVEKVMHHFRASNPSRDLAISIFTALIDLELEKKPRDLLYSTACKGGFTLCMLHLIVLDELIPQDLSVLLSLGLALQVVDDLQDVHQDLGEMTTTLATDNIDSSPNLRRQFARAINFIRHQVFPSSPLRKQKMYIEDGIVIVLKESLILLCMEAAVNTYSLLPADVVSLMQHCALSEAFLKRHPIEMSLYHLTSLF